MKMIPASGIGYIHIGWILQVNASSSVHYFQQMLTYASADWGPLCLHAWTNTQVLNWLIAVNWPFSNTRLYSVRSCEICGITALLMMQNLFK